MSKHVRKVTPQQQAELVAHYLAHGREASEIKCVEMGVCPRYAASVAAAWGKYRPRKFRGGGDIAVAVDHKDPRWAWAIERGPVLA